MVQQSKHGRVFWNFPGGHIEQNETPEQACIREVREETGYDVSINRLIYKDDQKFTFFVEIIGGEFKLGL